MFKNPSQKFIFKENMKRLIISINFLYLFLINTLFTKAQWTEQNSGITSDLYTVYTVNENVCWAGGPFGIVLRTSDGGLSWINVGNKTPIDNAPVGFIYALNENIALASLDDNPTKLCRTTNSGQNWEEVLQQENGFFDNVGFKDSLNGFLVGDPVGGRWSLWKTKDGGITWDSSGLYLPSIGNEISYNSPNLEIHNNEIWFGTSNYRIYHSSNFGETWNFFTLPCQMIGTLTLNSNVGFSAGGFYQCCVSKTTDGGLTWFTIPIYNYSGIFCFTHIDNYFWYNSHDTIYFSSDNGSSFSFQYSHHQTFHYYLSLNFKKINNLIVGWAVKDSGGISKYSAPIGIKPISSDVPGKFELYQNYPNPFNPSTHINFSLSKKVHVKIIIYDVSGRMVDNLVNFELGAGTYSTEWDASEFSSGVYFYILIADDKIIDTKKLVLLK